jgi:transposase InsO family protein
MMEKERFDPQKIAAFRFGVIGPLLANPPSHGNLAAEVKIVCAKPWPHPMTGKPWTISRRSVERWYYSALMNVSDPIGSLVPKGRPADGIGHEMTVALRDLLAIQFAQHKNWTYQLHADNLAAAVRNDPNLGPMPSYSTIKRYMKSVGWYRRKGWRPYQTAGQAAADARLADRQVRSYEVSHVGGLWHTDFHGGSIRLTTVSGELVTPELIAFIDDHSRLILHAQWYWTDSSEMSVHALMQAILKRGLPRKLMSDNGKEFIAGEFVQGLTRLSIEHETTLAYSPYQNGKQECFWAQLEGRCVAMLQGMPNVTLKLLNEATQAWVECEYNRKVHSETGTTPIDRFLHGQSVMRPSPTGEHLRDVFRVDVKRTQRQSDGTLSLEGRRFEVPDRFRHLRDLIVRYARWDLSRVDLVDPRSGKVIAPLYPLDKEANSSGRRRPREPLTEVSAEPVAPKSNTMPPLLKSLMEEYASTGMLPAYLPKDTNEEES